MSGSAAGETLADGPIHKGGHVTMLPVVDKAQRFGHEKVFSIQTIRMPFSDKAFIKTKRFCFLTATIACISVEKAVDPKISDVKLRAEIRCLCSQVRCSPLKVQP